MLATGTRESGSESGLGRAKFREWNSDGHLLIKVGT
jgi:hypothetical protein